ncbi:hypothetical protein [Sphingomonas montanisoli]|uniref:Uncharacterized protein n=1 Tax=Sphingomonas montanisoli TaxID=2606412 RepID=A0A5D9CA26_9SPHN|nr:hypothetical protein [Sphingomonas montanisoli]TZG28624.1 hypothetical protein FYJ91_00265 [Sphingomonas montanisoli]
MPDLSYQAPMGEPWFRKINPLLYWPIRRQGWLWIISMLILPWPFGFVFINEVEDNPILGWLCGIIFAVIALFGWAGILWKTEQNYDR